MQNLRTLAIAATMAMCSLGASAQARTISTNTSALDVAALQAPATPATLTRILFNGYNSLCLPFTLSAEQLQAAAPGVQVERFAGIRQEGSTLHLYFLDCTDEGIEAGQPYLIYSPRLQNLRVRSAEAQAFSATLHTVSQQDASGNRVTFAGSWTATSGNGRYGIPAQQETDVLQSILVSTTPEKTFLPTRCGFAWEAQNPTAVTLEVKHITSLAAIETGIDGLAAADALVDVYDLSGALVRSQVRASEVAKVLPRGIYVVGGEKVVVR